MKEIKLSKDEEVFAKQLFQVRQDIHKLRIEDQTQEDRLLAIMRGRGVRVAVGKEYIVQKGKSTGLEFVIVVKH